MKPAETSKPESTMDAEEFEITDNEFLRQFEATIEGELAKIEYVEQERKLFLTRLGMSDELKEKGYLNPFIKAVLDNVKERKSTIMPTSPEIVKFFRANKSYKSMLPTGINI